MKTQTKLDKKLADDTWLLRAWRRWRRERLDALLAGPYESGQALVAFFKIMTGPTALIDFITAGPWNDADADVRFEILALADTMIIKRREKMGLPPFDDSLPSEPPNVFLILRERLSPSPTFCNFPPDGGALRSECRLR